MSIRCIESFPYETLNFVSATALLIATWVLPEAFWQEVNIVMENKRKKMFFIRCLVKATAVPETENNFLKKE